MSKKPPPQVLFNFQEDDIPDAEGTEPPALKLELKDEQNDSAEEDFESYEDEIIKIEEKEKPNEKDIFEDIPSSPTPSIPESLPTPQVKQTKKPVKEKKKRKPMSEEHKKKLALAREKAMAVRKANAEEKKKMKALDKEEKELLKKQRFKKVKKLKEEVEQAEQTEEDEFKEVKVSNSHQQQSGITKKDLEEAQLDAIMKYEAIRKERKAKKKQEQIIEEGKKKMLNNIQRATGQYNYRDGSNRFDACY